MTPTVLRRLGLPLAGPLVSTALLALLAHQPGAWALGFVALVPWLLALQAARHWGTALLLGLGMTAGFTLAVFAWFGAAIGRFTGWGEPLGILALLLVSPLFQPQWLAYALVRHGSAQSLGCAMSAVAGAAAWVACEALLPKMLGDTLGHGLHGSGLLRQAADLGGAALLTFGMLLVNAALALAIHRAWHRENRWALPLTPALALLAAWFGYGALRLGELPDGMADTAGGLRVALVQANQTDYERRRREVGAYQVVREALDTHYALSWSALRDHHADVLLWSETVYPTTFGHPRNEAGAALDAEIQGFVDAAGVPLVFGTYDLDEAGEYNAAVFLEPGKGEIGTYRKSHPFPLTEHVPDWLDHAWLREVLPWTGGWSPGDGARVLPLRSADGRQVEVLPLICLDAVHPDIALQGARLGAQAIVTLSNDSWFTEHPAGLRLHLAVAAFRSIETRLPQLRVTTNGYSALVDAGGDILARTDIGQQAVLTGTLVANPPAPTLMVRWGDWFGRAAAGLLALLALLTAWRRWRPARPPVPLAAAWEATQLDGKTRWGLAGLQLLAAAGVAGLAFDMATRIGWQVQNVEQLQAYALAVLLPMVITRVIARHWRTMIALDGNLLVLTGRRERVEIPLSAIAALKPWRLPLPGEGIDVVLGSGRRWSLATPLGQGILAALQSAGVRSADLPATARISLALASDRHASRHRWLDRAWIKHGFFPLFPALIAFHLHQVITFGGMFGEWAVHGPLAWCLGLCLWWGSWSLGMALVACASRVVIELLVALTHRIGPRHSDECRGYLEWLARALHYLGIPLWLVLRVTGT